MSRRMSCSLTVDAVNARTKTVTRRHVDTWKTLEPGDRLTLIEKGMGLPKGTKQVVLAEVEVVSVRAEPLNAITDDDVRREGFEDWPVTVRHPDGSTKPGIVKANARWFIGFFMKERHCREDTLVRRIEWKYLDSADPTPAHGVDRPVVAS